jgi:hypothetical protein
MEREKQAFRLGAKLYREGDASTRDGCRADEIRQPLRRSRRWRCGKPTARVHLLS